MSKATPRPWRAGYTEEKAVVIRAEKEDGQPYLAMMVTNRLSMDDVEANADLIVKAVNRDHLFEEMVMACEMVLERWRFNNNQHHAHTWHDMQDCRAVIVPLLAKVKAATAPTETHS